jgi:hypothetical protein
MYLIGRVIREKRKQTLDPGFTPQPGSPSKLEMKSATGLKLQRWKNFQLFK